MLSHTRLNEILNKFSNKKIAVLGDMMLDEYIVGSVTRISPEAPVPVVNVEKESFVLGGAANVVNNLAELGVTVVSFGVIGDDENADKLLNEFNKKDVDSLGVIKSADRPTIMKKRVLAGNQQLLRLDWEKKHSISEELESKLLEAFSKKIDEIDGIILSDYDKGVLTETLAKKIIRLAKEKNKIILVDPKPSNSLNYKGATSMTPNLKESSECVGKAIPQTDEETFEIGREIREKLELDHLIMTRSEKGMSIFMEDRVEHIPTFAKEVFDVTGAGDTVISVYTLALTCGASYEEAAKIANTAAGVVVGRIGTATVTVEEIKEFYNEIYEKHQIEIRERKY